MLRSARVRAGLTQRELGRRAGVSVRTLRNIEQGRVRRPRPESVRGLAVAIGLDPAAALPASRHALPSDLPPAAMSSAAGVEIGVLGPLRMRRGGRPVIVGSRKQRLLLGLLALQPDQAVGREELIDVLWGEHPPRSCHSLIHTYVARLRGLLGPGVVVAVRGGHRLMVDGDQLDLPRFDELAARAGEVQATDPAAALKLLAAALGCWRGGVLADLPGRLHQHPAAVAASRRRLAVVLAHADLALGLGQPQQAAEQLQRLTPAEPLHEGLHARLMLALAGSGQQAAALRLFTELRGRLTEELGVEPGPALHDAQTRVLRGDLEGLPPATGSSPVAGPPAPAQLPADVIGFTGRAEHLAQLDALLPAAGAHSPTTVVITAIAGMAGVGKTALAIHWAHHITPRFGDGQLYVNLRGHAAGRPLDPLQALAVLLVGLGVSPDKLPIEVDAAAGLYRSLLAGKRMLVVLDNARDATQVRPLLPGSPGCVVVVTSRDALTGLVATHGADRLILDVLTPDEATILLEQVLGRDQVAAEAETAEQLAAACGWLPLALRIAAANLASQPGRSIAGYLAELQAGDRLAALAVDGDTDAAVRLAFDHSYQQLNADSRRLFRLLGLAPAPDISTQAAAALAGIPPQAAHRLLRMLAGAHLAELHEGGRVGLHDLLRLYARERAEQDDSAQQRDTALHRLHSWYLQAAGAAAELLYPDKLGLPVPPATGDAVPPAGFADAAGAVAWLDAERANLVAAVQHTAEHGPWPTAWLLADALRGYFLLRRSTVDWLVVARAGLTAAAHAGDERAQAASQLNLGHAHAAVGRYPQAITHYTATLTLARQGDWTDGQAAALNYLGLAHWWSGSLQQAADHHLQSLTLKRQSGRLDGQANSHVSLGLVYWGLGRLRDAADHQTQALAMYRQLGSPHGEAHALGALGMTDHELGRLDRAHEHLTRALTLHREVGDRFGQAYVTRALAAVHRDAGRHHQALDLAQAALTLAAEIGHRYIEAVTRNTLGSVYSCLGHHQVALEEHQQALRLARQTAIRTPEVGALLGLAATYQHTGQPAGAIDHAEQALTIASRVGLRILEGQAHTTLAAAHHTLGDHDRALTHAKQALELHQQTGHRIGQAHTLHLLGLVRRSTQGAQSAAACWQEALDVFAEIGSPEADTVRGLLRT